MPNYDPSLDNSPITRVVSTNADGSPNYTGGTTVDGQYLSTPPTLSNTQTSPLMLDSSGRLITNNAPLTGTADSVAINDGTNTLTVPTQASTTAAQTGLLIQGATTTSAPTYTTAKTNPLSLDTAGNLRVASSLAAGSNLVGNVGINNGTNTVGTVNASGVATTQNSLLVSGSGYTTGTISLSAGTQATSWYDMLNYAWVSVEILTNTTPATLTFQTSGDASQTNITSTSLIVANASGNVSPATSTTSAANTYHGPRSGRYFRVNSNLAGGNTATLVLTFYTTPSQGIFGATTVSAQPISGTTGAGSFLHIAAGQATTTVKSGAGTLYSIILNSAATATNVTTIYDNTAASGTVIGIPAATTATVPSTLNFGPVGLAFATGLTIITATANGSDMTVVYK